MPTECSDFRAGVTCAVWGIVIYHVRPLLVRRAGVAFSVSMGGALVVGCIFQQVLGLSVLHPAKAALTIFVLGVMSLGDLGLHPSDAMGPANGVTLARGVLVSAVAAMIGEPSAAAWLWLTTPLAMVALALDGVDGYVARRCDVESPFGARLDMELDALLTMVLAVLVWQTGRAPAWVLASGAMRYAFVAAAVVAPWLRAPLPPRYRRKVVCVLQIGSLILCLLPFLAPPLTVVIAAVGLLALSGSFAVDVVWLWRRR